MKTERCIACGACVEICPVSAIKIIDKKAKINPKIVLAVQAVLLFVRLQRLSWNGRKVQARLMRKWLNTQKQQ